MRTTESASGTDEGGGDYLGLSLIRAPKKNHKSIEQIGKAIVQWFKKHGTRPEIYHLSTSFLRAWKASQRHFLSKMRKRKKSGCCCNSTKTKLMQTRWMQYLNNGSNWNGQQIISEKWIKTSTSANTTSDPSIEYQYGWWIYPSQEGIVDSRHFSARGNFGQFIYINPEERLIIVRHGYDVGDVNWINLFESISKAMR